MAPTHKIAGVTPHKTELPVGQSAPGFKGCPYDFSLFFCLENKGSMFLESVGKYYHVFVTIDGVLYWILN
jgi:hypothetical protein